MRNKLEYIQVIDKYLRGVLSKEDTAIFENRLTTDSQLREEVAKQKLLMEGIKRNALKASAQKGRKTYKKLKTLKTVAITAAVVAITALSVYTFSKTKEQSKPEMQETSQPNLGIESLDNQGFQISTLSDTVIETENGSVFAIPAEAFETEDGESVSGEINFEIKEAFDNVDIMKAGLTTTSDGELLETGGMFFLEATHKGKKLRLKKGKEILSQLPNLNPEKEMQLYDGEKKADGTINWVNPKPFEKELITVDITFLDFYPEGYVEEVSKTKTLKVAQPMSPAKEMASRNSNGMKLSFGFSGNFKRKELAQDQTQTFEEVIGTKIYSKEFTDSLYYSFARLFEKKGSPEILEIRNGKKNTIRIIDVIAVPDTGNNNSPQKKLNGKALFKQNCASCHHPIKDGTGPGLLGSFQKWKNAGDDIYKFIRNPQAQYDAGVQSALNIDYQVGGMAGVGVSNEEIDAIFSYIDRFSKGDDQIDDSLEACPIPSGINPAKVKAIWNKKFNNTILATKEFEERMKVIHESHQDRILQVYVRNLDKPLWYSDSIAMITFSGTADKFRTFYEQKKGGVNVKDKLAAKLSSYFNKKQKEFTSKSADAFQEFQEKKQKLREEFRGKQGAKVAEEVNRQFDVFVEEFETNLCEAYRQLDRKGDCKTRRITTPLFTKIKTLGPKNIDRAVFEATRDRKTLDWTDPVTGKKAVIKYEPLKVKVLNNETFDRIFMYLVPDKLNSFNRMETKGKKEFNLPINELLNYEVKAIAYKGASAFYAEIKSIKSGSYEISLSPITDRGLKRKLRKTKNSIEKDIKSDLDFYQEELVNKNREKKYKKDNELTLRIGKFLFPELDGGCILRSRFDPNYRNTFSFEVPTDFQDVKNEYEMYTQ